MAPEASDGWLAVAAEDAALPPCKGYPTAAAAGSSEPSDHLKAAEEGAEEGAPETAQPEGKPAPQGKATFGTHHGVLVSEDTFQLGAQACHPTAAVEPARDASGAHAAAPRHPGAAVDAHSAHTPTPPTAPLQRTSRRWPRTCCCTTLPSCLCWPPTCRSSSSPPGVRLVPARTLALLAAPGPAQRSLHSGSAAAPRVLLAALPYCWQTSCSPCPAPSLLLVQTQA